MQRDGLTAIKHISANSCVEIRLTAALHHNWTGPWMSGWQRDACRAENTASSVTPKDLPHQWDTHIHRLFLNSTCSLLCQALCWVAGGLTNDDFVYMNQEGRKEDLAHCPSGIKQVRCIPWGWTRHSHSGTCAGINMHTTPYQRHSSHCSSHHWDLCSVWHYSGQPSQLLLLSLLWLPTLLCAPLKGRKRWMQKGNHSVSHQWSFFLSFPGGRAEQNPAEADT